MITILTVLLIYTIPSNFVFIMVLLMLFRNKSIFIGCVITAILYTPLMRGMLNDPQLQNNFFRIETITNIFPEVLKSFISYRWLLLPFVFYGLYFVSYGLYKVFNRHMQAIITCITMLITPFIIFYIHGGTVYGRTFLPLLPFFCLLTAIGLDIKKPLLMKRLKKLFNN